MAYLALYRKYRPSGFDGVIGQEHVIQTLVNQIVNDRLGHAYLFTGTRGTGKTSVAKIFAKAINCQNPQNGSPCGKCSSCLSLSDPSNIDVIEIDAASNNGVNEIRDIRENVQYPPVSCKYKVYIVDEVHMLSGAAFNALLKTLEEPPKHAVFILATTEVHKIPATILSRCMRFDFRLVSTERIAELIAKVYDSEGKKYDKEAVFAIAKAGEGSVRDALSIADIAFSVGEGKLTYEDVMNVLGASNNQLIEKLLTAILSDNSGEVLSVVHGLVGLGKSIGVLVKDVTAYVRDLIVVKTCKDANKILGLPDYKFANLVNLANLVTVERLIRCLEIFSEVANNLRYSNNPRIVFETALLKAAKPDADMDVSALLARISALENLVKNGKINIDVTKDESAVCSNAKTENITTTKQNQEAKDDNQLKKLSELTVEQLKGELLGGLRSLGHELLFDVMQKVKVSINGRIVSIDVNNTTDFELLDRQETKNKLINALSNVEDFELVVNLSKRNVELKEIDDATKKIKQIFGDDIVIIKD